MYGRKVVVAGMGERSWLLLICTLCQEIVIKAIEHFYVINIYGVANALTISSCLKLLSVK